MTFTKQEAETAKNLEKLGLTAEEIEQTILDDRRINQGENLFELTEEQKKASKKARGTGTRKASPTERKRKEDADKRELIDSIVQNLIASNVTVTNPERQIDFEFHNRKFRIVLSAPRS